MKRDRKAIHQEFLRELSRARERVITGADAEAGWLVRFLQMDLESLTPGEWMTFAYEVAAFVETDLARKQTMPLVSATGWAIQSMPGEAYEYTLPSPKEAGQLQHTIKHHLRNLWESGMMPVRFKTLTLVVTQPGEANERRGHILVATKPKSKEFEYRMALVVAQHAGRIRMCQECERIFLAVRRDQFYCGPRCHMRVASRKRREGQSRGRKSAETPTSRDGTQSVRPT
jgi:hypothetical protein